MRSFLAALTIVLAVPAAAQDPFSARLQPMDVFALEYAAEPQVSPDGRTIVYARRSFDIMTDKARSNLWTVDVRSGAHRPLLTGTTSYSGARWSPDGTRIAYVTSADREPQIYVRWLDSGATARITELTEPPQSMAWSPDGRSLAFTMFVKDEGDALVELPEKPEGAEWNAPPIVIDRISYRGDGAGYYEQGVSHVFIVSAEGGTPRQITRGDFDYSGTPAWAPDGRTLYVSADRTENWRRGEGQAEIFAIDVASGDIRQLTDNDGPDLAPAVSPDGRRIAYLRSTENLKAYQPLGLWVMNADGSAPRRLVADIDVGVDALEWTADGRDVVFMFDQEGTTYLAEARLDGGVRRLASQLGGEDLGRPYGAAGFSVADDARTIAFNVTDPVTPAELAVIAGNGVRRLTRLNDDLAAVRRLVDAEELWVTAPDGVRSQWWLMRPPGFEPGRTYPMILEIHGGPHANYGARFSAEMQLYAAAGYAVLFGNPRGSTSYGEAFGNMIDKTYPGPDYQDLMAAVDAALARGFVDESELFVTGGSGGGVLTAWIVGKTDRFKAAVVAKPVINWQSFVLTADGVPYFWKYWFGSKPWENPEGYWARSPLSLVGNVKTPTMLLTGEDDYRTPISETEQYYAALQLQGVDTAMVRIPGASHSITARPSNLIAKVAAVLAWFEKYRGEDAESAVAASP